MEIKFFILFIFLCGVLNMLLDKPFERGPIMLFYKVLILFWGCTKTCSHARWFENHIIFHIITIPLSPYTNDSISSGFDEGPPSYKRNVLWLVSCPSALWLALYGSVIGEQLRRCFHRHIYVYGCFSTAPPLAKTASSFNMAISSQTLIILNKRVVQNLCTDGYCKTY